MKLYRVESSTTADFSDDESWFAKRMLHFQLYVLEFEVIRETPKGKWLRAHDGEHWVSNTSNKRYAFPTVPEAY